MILPLSCAAFAGFAGLLQAELDAVLDVPALDGALIAVSVTELSGAPVYTRNAGLRMMPASNQKLLSGAFALHSLGAEFRPETRFWKGPGLVHVASEGDPSMTSENLRQVAETLKLSGKDRVAVKQAYRPLIPDSWEWDDLPNRYAAPVTAFTVDQGAFELWAESGRLRFRPRNYGASAHHLSKEGPLTVRYEPWRKRAVVQGALPSGTQRLDTLALPFPDEAAASYLGASFGLTGRTPDRAPDLVLRGRPLREVLKTCLEKSENNLAEHLFLLASRAEGPEVYPAARKTMLAFLEGPVGVPKGDVRPSDGSGLSRHNLVTARAVGTLLRWCATQSWFETWRDALCAPGEGTLICRLPQTPFEGKTGTLDRVASLSGYVRGPGDEIWVVSLLLNHYNCETSEARKVCDNFINTLSLARNLQ